MTPYRLLCALCALLLSACATTSEPEGERFYVVRHFEKVHGADPGLSPEGQANASRLVALLAGDPPDAIYVSATRRARESAAPAAARFGLTLKEYDPRNTAAMLERVRAEAGTVLVVGHSNTVPDVVEGLGGTRPADLTEADYGQVWIVSRADGTTATKSLGGS